MLRVVSWAASEDIRVRAVERILASAEEQRAKNGEEG